MKPVRALAEAAAGGPVGASTAGGARIQCLDGLRAFSIAFVLLGHLWRTQGFPLPDAWTRLAPSAHLGVRVFFVISGFLITTLLLREIDKTGRVSLPRFYLRRTFRIFPAFYVYVLCVVALSAAGTVVLHRHDVLAAVTYTTNYHSDRAWYLGHTWSLAVEEQFYLLWPAILLVAGRRRGLFVAVAAIVLAPFVRCATFVLLPDARAGIGETFQTAADAIATGCVLAYVRGGLAASRLYRQLQRPVPMLLVVGLVYAADRTADYVSISYTVGETVMNAGLAVAIDWCLRHPASWVGRLLEWGPIAFVGQLSYSLYLWQQPFLNRHSAAWISSFPVNLALAFACALTSYFLVEKTFLRMRERIEARVFARPRAGQVPLPAEAAGPAASAVAREP